ncbi:hypothetical protein [Ensifer sp. LCM 4579]|uniref:hypothetical protein n=1 Tax=Ensifer sp. LCM 4579 TaxID=1848292 RepID=UPI0008D9A1CD|nr:hypothetical protein [Ensifer sp. LCM 4579]OHV75337.1 hypothetical protein LCM4579_07330 [Ensifer sp. LCM 4579]
MQRFNMLQRPLRIGKSRGAVEEIEMPTLFRFLFFCAVVAGMVYATMLALVTFVEPVERDVTVRIPSERINEPQ